MKSLIASGHLWTYFWVLFIVLGGSLCGTYAYRRFALRNKIVAEINFRSSHERIVPRGGGLPFACVFSIAVIATWAMGAVPTWLMLCLGLGGAAAAVIGFVDDVFGIHAVWKLLAQTCLAAWTVAVFLALLKIPVFGGNSGPALVASILIALFSPVWFINLYGFSGFSGKLGGSMRENRSPFR